MACSVSSRRMFLATSAAACGSAALVAAVIVAAQYGWARRADSAGRTPATPGAG